MNKNIKTYLLFLLINFLGVGAYSQVTIKGNVADESNGNVLPGASVIIHDLNLTTTTDKNGNYTFSNIQAGTYIINVSFVGYRDISQYVIIAQGVYKQNFLLYPKSVEMDSVIVTATLTDKNINDIPASVGVVTHEQLQSLPCISVDEYLSSIAGINDARPYGIFNQSGNVTMRGLNRNVYTLLLIDGIPASVVDGGATNWNRIDPDNIERIEVIKGPNSSLYGSNAMDGVINIITKHPAKPFTGDVSAFYGTYNTYGGNINLSGSTIKNDKGFYWLADGFIRRSDGYVLQPDSTADSTSAKTYLKDNDASLRAGYSFNKNNNLELQADLSNETLGVGKKIYESDGSYDNTLYQFWQAHYHGLVGKLRISASAFYKIEYDYSQRESIKQSGAYTLFNNHTTSSDEGIWCNASLPIKANQLITFGFDSKLGKTTYADIYRTSTDTVNYKGNLNYYGLFVQDDIDIFKDRLKAIAGLRYDLVNFYNANFYIADPSGFTSYMLPYLQPLSKKTWDALSPKAGLLYKITGNTSAYINVSRGFRSATLNDLCQTGDVNKGFKIANPNLQPEYLNNIETGAMIQLKKLDIEPTLFYSIGQDFQYFLGTGDSLYTTKTKEEAVIERENIKKVEIYGAELSVNYTVNNHISLFATYAYNHSQIKKVDTSIINSAELTGKILTNVPMHNTYSGVEYKSKLFALSLTYRYTSSNWYDDENTVKIAGYSLFDAKISKTFYNKLRLSVTVQNILNTMYLDNKGQRPPGRFIIAELRYNF